MTYKEFKKKIKDLGYDIENLYPIVIDGVNQLGVTKNGSILLSISLNEEYSIDTVRDMFSMLSYTDRADLFDICHELIRTPIEYRGDYEKALEEQLYYVKFIEGNDSFEYLNKRVDTGELLVDNKNNTYLYQTKFTREEVEELDNRYLKFMIPIENDVRKEEPLYRAMFTDDARKEEPLYRVMFTDDVDGYDYLNQDINTGELSIDGKKDGEFFKDKFTREEIKEINPDYLVFAVEVEDD